MLITDGKRAVEIKITITDPSYARPRDITEDLIITDEFKYLSHANIWHVKNIDHCVDQATQIGKLDLELKISPIEPKCFTVSQLINICYLADKEMRSSVSGKEFMYAWIKETAIEMLSGK